MYLKCQGISQTKCFNSNFWAMPGAGQPAGTVRRWAVCCLSQATRQRDQEAVCELLRNGGKYQRLLPLVHYTHTMQQWPKDYSRFGQEHCNVSHHTWIRVCLQCIFFSFNTVCVPNCIKRPTKCTFSYVFVLKFRINTHEKVHFGGLLMQLTTTHDLYNIKLHT